MNKVDIFGDETWHQFILQLVFSSSGLSNNGVQNEREILPIRFCTACRTYLDNVLQTGLNADYLPGKLHCSACSRRLNCFLPSVLCANYYLVSVHLFCTVCRRWLDYFMQLEFTAELFLVKKDTLSSVSRNTSRLFSTINIYFSDIFSYTTPVLNSI